MQKSGSANTACLTCTINFECVCEGQMLAPAQASVEPHTCAFLGRLRLSVSWCFLMLFSPISGLETSMMEAAGGVVTRVKGGGI